MKVKIGNKIYDSEKKPIMIIMTPNEKESLHENFIKLKKAKKFCEYPDTKYWNDNDYRRIKKWMELNS